MLWYPVGFTAGYLALLLFVAAPLRRSGAYTLPDFCRGAAALGRRCASWPPRSWCCIGWLYLVPQLQGAGLTLSTVTGAAGLGRRAARRRGRHRQRRRRRMRSITSSQAFQYWLKLTALPFPGLVAAAGTGSGATAPRHPTRSR